MFISKFGSAGSGDGEFKNCQGITLGNGGRIYIGDSSNNRVQVFDAGGIFLSKFGTLGNGPTQMRFPTGVKVESTTGKIYVIDQANHRVHILFDPTEWTKPGTSKLVQLPLDQALTLNNGFNLQVSNNTSLNVGGDLTLNGGIFGTGSLTFNGGSITDNVGTTLAFPLTLGTAGGTFNSPAGGNTFTYSGDINGVGGLALGGGGTTVLSGNNPYLGGTNITGSTTLAVSSDSNMGNTAGAPGALLFGNGTLQFLNGFTTKRTIVLNPGGGIIDTNGNNVELQGDIINSGSLTKTGAGTLRLSGNNTFGGGLFINEGTVAANSNDRLGTLGKLISFNGGTLQFLNGAIVSRPMTLNNGGGTLSLTGNTVEFQGPAISGPGAFIINGPGTFVPQGGNTYLGGTTLKNGAVINFSQNSNLGDPSGNLTFDNGTLFLLAGVFTNRGVVLNTGGGTIDTHGNVATLAGLIQDGTLGGGLTITGGGTLSLANFAPGGNTYSGGTLLTGGTTLEVVNDNQLGTGDFTFNNGTLHVIADNFVSGRRVNLTGQGTVNVDAGLTNVVFNGSFIGAGAFTKVGTGNLTLTNGGNAFGGGILLNGGTLTGNAGSLNASSIQNNATLVFNQPNAGTFSGNIGGLGFVKTGPGVLTMTGNYASLTTLVSIQEGEVIFTQSVPNGINLAPNTTLDFRPAPGGTLTYGGQISGAGGVQVDGSGAKVIMTGTQAYTGPTSVKNGILALNGSARNSAVAVSPGATLMGNGTMLSLMLAGTIAPGNSIGTQTILGNYAMAPTATYEAEVDPNGTSDLIAVGGTTTLGGTLDVISDNPRQALKSQTYTILTSTQGVVGRFAETISSNRIKYTVQYLSNAVKVLVNIHQDFVDLFPSTNTSNAGRTARYFDTFADTVSTTSDLGGIIQTLDGMLAAGDTASLTNAFNQIQPSQYREVGLLSFLNSELVAKNVQSQQQYLRETHHLEAELRKLEGVSAGRMASFYKLVDNTLSKGFNFARVQENTVGPKRTLLSFLAPHGAEGSGMPGSQRIRLGCSSVWFQSYGQIHEKDSSNGNVGLRSQTGGLSMGADHEIIKNTFVGLFGGLSTTPFEWKNGRGNGHMNSYYGGLYGTWLSDMGLYVDGQVMGGQDRYRSNRTIRFANINRSAQESHYGNQFSVDTEVGYAWDVPLMTIQPYVGASYMLVRENGYTEKNAGGLNFAIKSKTSQFARGTVGAQFYRTFVCGETLFRPALQLAFVRKQPVGSNANINGGLVNQPQTLSVLGDNKARNQFAPGISLTTQFKSGAYIIANVSGQVFSGQNTGEALVRVGYDF